MRDTVALPLLLLVLAAPFCQATTEALGEPDLLPVKIGVEGERGRVDTGHRPGPTAACRVAWRASGAPVRVGRTLLEINNRLIISGPSSSSPVPPSALQCIALGHAIHSPGGACLRPALAAEDLFPFWYREAGGSGNHTGFLAPILEWVCTKASLDCSDPLAPIHLDDMVGMVQNVSE